MSSMEERFNRSWRNVKKAAADDDKCDDDSESLVPGADEESIEYVEEYEEEYVSEEELYEEEVLEVELSASFGEIETSGEEEGEPVAQDQLGFKSNEAEPPAVAVEVEMTPTMAEESATTSQSVEQTVNEALARGVFTDSKPLAETNATTDPFNHNDAEWTTFDSTPTESSAIEYEERGAEGEEEKNPARETTVKELDTTTQATLSSSADEDVSIAKSEKMGEGQITDEDFIALSNQTEAKVIARFDPQEQTPALSPNAADAKKIGWEKPDWTMTSPLKNKKMSVNLPLSSPEKNLGWEKPNWTKATLRSTGKDVKTGIDLQAPITHVRKVHMDDINFEANPMVLKPTIKGSDVRLGENLAKPITHIAKDPLANINSVANPELALKATDVGVKLKQKGDLQAPITHVTKDRMDDINFEANPLVLKSSEKGTAVRLGENLARPITFINGKKPSDATD